MRNYAGTCKGICSLSLFDIAFTIASTVFVVPRILAWEQGNVNSKVVPRMKLFLSM